VCALRHDVCVVQKFVSINCISLFDLNFIVSLGFGMGRVSRENFIDKLLNGFLGFLPTGFSSIVVFRLASSPNEVRNRNDSQCQMPTGTFHKNSPA